MCLLLCVIRDVMTLRIFLRDLCVSLIRPINIYIFAAHQKKHVVACMRFAFWWNHANSITLIGIHCAFVLFYWTEFYFLFFCVSMRFFNYIGIGMSDVTMWRTIFCVEFEKNELIVDGTTNHGFVLWAWTIFSNKN